MIKRVIFDLDNTLIMWNDEYYNTLNQTLDYFNIEYNEDIKTDLIKAVNDYEDKYDTFKYENINQLMKEYSGVDLPDDFVLRWTEQLENAIPSKVDSNLIDTLEYLSQKYELVVLTNWFTKQQTKRLENYGILKYFKEVIGADMVKNKPNKESYTKACSSYDLSECIMIGDSLENDVIGAINIGLRAILFDFKNNYDSNIENIKNMNELKDIL